MENEPGSRRPICSIAPTSLVVNEIIIIIASLRKHSRWSSTGVAAILGGAISTSDGMTGGSSGSGGGNGGGGSGSTDDNFATKWGLRASASRSTENPLMSDFSKLRSDISDANDISEFDTPRLLQPFLAVIKSSSVTGSITSLALNSISKFFAYGIISERSPRLALSMRLLSSAVTHCRFEASDSAQDEVVLLKILKVMEDMMTGVGGSTLSDESVCEMLETGLSMCCQLRLSELLRRSAEISMIKMVQTIFERLKDIEVAQDDEDLEVTRYLQDVNLEQDTIIQSKADDGEEAQPKLPASMGEQQPEEQSKPIEPYGLGSIRELLRVLISLLDPHNGQQTDTMRIMALKILDVAFEVGGSEIGCHSFIRGLAVDDLCRYLLQLVRSDNQIILSNSLRATMTLIYTMRPHLKLQQELFLSYVISCLYPKTDGFVEANVDPIYYEGVPSKSRLKSLTSGNATPVPVKDRQRMGLEGSASQRTPESRESMIECLSGLIRIPSYMVDLYVNYDCEPNMENLCEDVIGLLGRNAYVDAALWSTPNVPPLCLEALLSFVKSVHSRISKRYAEDPNLPRPERLMEQVKRKRLVVTAATMFNENPANGIKFMKENALVDAEASPKSVATFLRSTYRFNKKLLGEYLVQPKNKELLHEFIALFDFSGMRVDEALRELMQSFRLPGESQQIERFVESFAAHYCEEKHASVANADAVFVLAYAIIMLNTDQHSPNVRNRMTFDHFKNNLRGLNDNNDFDIEYLRNIYDAIKKSEIIIAEEHDNDTSFEMAWKEMMSRAPDAGPLIICETNIYDKMLFQSTWKPIITALSYVFSTATDDAVYSRVINAFNQCAEIAHSYRIPEMLDHLILLLSKMTGLTNESYLNTSANTIVEADSSKFTVSSLSVRFGRSFKSQLATVVLFRMAAGYEGAIRHGWRQIFGILNMLLVNRLLPPAISPLHQFMDLEPLPLPKNGHSAKKNGAAPDTGLFSALSSYLANYNDDQLLPSEDEIESTMCTIDCVASCRIDHLLANMLRLNQESTDILLGALLSDDVKALKKDEKQQMEGRPETEAESEKGLNVDAKAREDSLRAIHFWKTEIALSLALRDEKSLRATGPIIASLILANSRANDELKSSRNCVYLLRVVRGELDFGLDVIDKTEVVAAIESLSDDALLSQSFSIAEGLTTCVNFGRETEFLDHEGLYIVLEKLAHSSKAKRQVLELASRIADKYLTEKNFVYLVNIFAAIAREDSRHIAMRFNYERKHRGKSPPKDDYVYMGTEALAKLLQLAERAPTVASNMDESVQWKTFFEPAISRLAENCCNNSRNIRQTSFNYLQRMLTAVYQYPEEHQSNPFVFNDILFPLPTAINKSQLFRVDPKGALETLAQTISLTCKVYLHCILKSSHSSDAYKKVWAELINKVVEMLETTKRKSEIVEAATESIKNVILVIQTSSHHAGEPTVLAEPEPSTSTENMATSDSEGGQIEPSEDDAAESQEQQSLSLSGILLEDDTLRRLDMYLPEVSADLKTLFSGVK